MFYVEVFVENACVCRPIRLIGPTYVVVLFIWLFAVFTVMLLGWSSRLSMWIKLILSYLILCNCGHILYRFGDKARYWSKTGTLFIPVQHDNFLGKRLQIVSLFSHINHARSMTYHRRAGAIVGQEAMDPIIIIIISTTMFMVLSSWQSHCEVHPVHLMNVEWRQAAADPRPSQTT